MKNDMKSQVQQIDVYPSDREMASIDEATSFLPHSLRSFLQCLFTSAGSTMTVASLGQAIVQATRPRVILSPLQLVLGVQTSPPFRFEVSD